MSPALNYGQQSAEGLKAFRGPNNKTIAIFRPDRNAHRMQHSADVASMPHVPVDMFVQACRSVVALNACYVPPHESEAALYLRPQLYGSSPQLSLAAPEEFTFCVYAVPTGGMISRGPSPVTALILDDFDRTAPNGSGHAKLGGNYAPVIRWSDKARKDGFGLTLHLDSAKHEYIDEFSSCAFVGVKSNPDDENEVTILIPDSKCIIDSITSQSIAQISRSFGWKVEKRPVKYTELPDLSEVLAVGTAAIIVPVRSITRRQYSGLLVPGPRVSIDRASEKVTYIPDSHAEAGPVCAKLLTRFKEIQLALTEDTFGWRFEVTEADMRVENYATS